MSGLNQDYDRQIAATPLVMINSGRKNRRKQTDRFF